MKGLKTWEKRRFNTIMCTLSWDSLPVATQQKHKDNKVNLIHMFMISGVGCKVIYPNACMRFGQLSCSCTLLR